MKYIPTKSVWKPWKPHGSHICLQLTNLLSYPFSILQPLLKSLHSYQVLLTLFVILIQSLPLSSNNANLFFFPQSQISSTYLCPLESFLINSKTVLYIHFSKNPTLTKKTYPTTGQYLTYLTYPNSQNDLLKTDLLTISMKTISWTLSSLPSAYTKFNSTETTLLAVHDHIIRAMSQQQLSHWSVSTWSFCRLWHYWPCHSSTSTQILVWFHWHCLILDSVFPFISFLYCWYQWHQISSL